MGSIRARVCGHTKTTSVRVRKCSLFLADSEPKPHTLNMVYLSPGFPTANDFLAVDTLPILLTLNKPGQRLEPATELSGSTRPDEIEKRFA